MKPITDSIFQEFLYIQTDVQSYCTGELVLAFIRRKPECSSRRERAKHKLQISEGNDVNGDGDDGDDVDVAGAHGGIRTRT